MYAISPCYYWLSVFKIDVRHGKHVRDQSVLLLAVSVWNRCEALKTCTRSVRATIGRQCLKQTWGTENMYAISPCCQCLKQIWGTENMFVISPCCYWLPVFETDIRHWKHVRDQSVLLLAVSVWNRRQILKTCTWSVRAIMWSLSVFETDVRHKKHVHDRSVQLCIVSQCVKQT